MADWPVSDGGCPETLTADESASLPSATYVTCAANDTKSSWDEMIASTAHKYGGLLITLSRSYGSSVDTVMIDIGIGGSGSEVALIENITMSIGEYGTTSFFLPVEIPAGTRISARGQTSDSTARAVDIGLVGLPSNFMSQSYNSVETYGANTATTEGVEMTLGAGAHTKGSYAEISSAISRDIKYLIVDVHWSNVGTSSDRLFLFDIAVGASGSEQIILSNLWVRATMDEAVFPSVFGFPVQIPAGSRIAARAQQSGTDAGYTIHLVLHGSILGGRA